MGASYSKSYPKNKENGDDRILEETLSARHKTWYRSKSNLEDTFLLMKVKPKNTYFLFEVKSRMSVKQQARVELMSQEL